MGYSTWMVLGWMFLSNSFLTTVWIQWWTGYLLYLDGVGLDVPVQQFPDHSLDTVVDSAQQLTRILLHPPATATVHQQQ